MSILLDVLNGKKTDRPPVWFMRQAGRLLKSYRDLKKKHSFETLLKTPELAIEVTLQPIRDLGVDAAILFSDILVVPEALGMELKWTNEGPRFHQSLTEGFVLKPCPQKLIPTYEAIKGVRENLPKDKCLIGFSGGVLTVFCYMVEGLGGNGNFPEAIKYLYKHPKESEILLEAITEMSINYVEKQVQSGIEVFQLFETWAGLIPYSLYEELILPKALKILDVAKKKKIPTVFFPRGIGLGLYQLPPNIADGVSIDWQMPLKEVFHKVPKKWILQGNIDPRFILHSDTFEEIEKKLSYYKKIGERHHNWIINLGHGVLPGTPEKNVKALVNWVKQTNWKR